MKEVQAKKNEDEDEKMKTDRKIKDFAKELQAFTNGMNALTSHADQVGSTYTFLVQIFPNATGHN